MLTCKSSNKYNHEVFREKIKISLPDYFENTSKDIFLNDDGQAARFTARDNSREIYLSLAGNSSFDAQELFQSMEIMLIKRHPDIKIDKFKLNIPIQNVGVYYSYSSNNSIGAIVYFPFKNQKFSLNFTDEKGDKNDLFEQVENIMNSILELNK